MSESMLFIGSFVAYTGLGISTTLTFRGTFDRRVAAAVAVIVTAHVFGIWSHRYGWDFNEAVRNGYAGFILFHLSLIAIDAAVFVPDRLGTLFHRAAFVVVSLGSIVAAFTYDAVAIYRIPLLFVLVMTIILSVRGHRARTEEPHTA